MSTPWVPALQLVGGVSGAVLTVSGLMLVNSLNFLNQAENSQSSFVLEAEKMRSEGVDLDDTLRTIKANKRDSTIPPTWKIFRKEEYDRSVKLEGLRRTIWDRWNYVFFCSIISIIIALLGIVSPLPNSGSVLFSGAFLFFEIIIFYFFAYGAYILSTIASRRVPEPLDEPASG